MIEIGRGECQEMRNDAGKCRDGREMTDLSKNDWRLMENFREMVEIAGK